MNKLKAAVVGVGHLGQHHARIYTQLSDVELIAVADSDQERAKTIAQRHGVRAVTDYRSLLSEVNLVSIASPTFSHFEIARDFLKAGIHVLVEKPITNDIHTAREMVAMACEKKCKLQVGHSERFNPIAMELFKRDIRPVYIEAIRTSPFRFRSSDIGVVLDMMIHDIDIVHCLTRSRVKKVEAFGSNLLGKLEDIATARLYFESGCIANLTANRAANKAMRQIRIFTPSSFITVDYATMQGKIWYKPDNVDPVALNLQQSVPEHLRGLSFEEMFFGKILQSEDLSAQPHEPLYVELSSFIRSIRDDSIPVVSGEDGLSAIEVADMIIRDLGANLERWKQKFIFTKENVR